MSVIPNSEQIRRLEGLDILRLGAMVLITIQHAFTLTTHDRWTTYRSLNVGQLGVAIFLGISAVLASISHRRAVPWLAQRLRRLYPSYWLAMVLCFTLAWVTGYKHFTSSQFLSQMLGIGLFTHPGNLINVPTWFISFIIICYFFTFIGRITTRPLLVNLFLGAATISWGAFAGFRWPWMHFVTFFATSALAIACPEKWHMLGFITAGIGVLLLSPWSVAFSYTGITLLSIGAAFCVSKVPRFASKMAEYSYEYYLVHGVFLIGTISALRDHPAIAVACGVSLALVASVLLNRFVSWVVGRLVLRPRESLAHELVSVCDRP